MSGSAFSSSAFAAYAAAIRQKESTNDYTAVNSYGYMGAYQMGREALTDAGFQDKNGKDGGRSVYYGGWSSCRRAIDGTSLS